MIYRTGCWMCGGIPDSREHRYKRSELKRLFPPRKNKYHPYTEDEQPLGISFDDGKVFRITGPDANTGKYPRLICKRCNNEKTQRMDIAYEKFSTYCWENPEATSINLSAIWGANYQRELSHFYGYFLKILGCEILSSGFLLPEDFPNPLDFKLENSNLKLSICKSPNMAIIHPRFTKEMNYTIIGKKALLGSLEKTSLEELSVKRILNLIWHRQIGNYQINFWFNIEPNSFLGFPLDGSKEMYNVPDIQIDCFDMDYVSNALIFGTTHNKWLAESPKEGHPYNQYKLGLKYATGNGVKKNISKAIHLYKSAAEKGHVIAQTDLGLLYFEGIGVEKNIHKAIELWELAANEEFAPAQNNLGYLFEQGLGVSKDYDEAIRLYELAAAKGYSTARYNLGNMYFNGIGVEKNIHKAIELWELAANEGHVMAQNNLGCLYASGNEIEKDHHIAIKWWKLAADQEHISAQKNLQYMIETR